MKAKTKEMLTGRAITAVHVETVAGGSWSEGGIGNVGYDGVVKIELEGGYQLVFTPHENTAGRPEVGMHVWSPRGRIIR